MITLHCGDCLDILPELEANSIDAIVTDPPYGLEFMGKEWDRLWVEGEQGQQGRINGQGGMETWGKRPQYQGGLAAQEWHHRWAVEALRVAKPGAHLLAFGGTRTFHRLACAIEDAGWEIRDTVMWVYGSGFPKSLDVSKAIDKMAGAEREVVGRNPYYCEGRTADPGEYRQGGKNGSSHITAPATDAARQWDGWGTALKPAWEPIIVARKPLAGTVAENVLEWGTGALNIDGCRVPTNGDAPKGSGLRNSWRELEGRQDRQSWNGGNITPAQGRWPANLIHDGSDEVLAGFPANAPSGGGSNGGWQKQYVGGGGIARVKTNQQPDTGSAARFFYCAKASRQDRDEGLQGMDWHTPGECTDRTDGTAGLDSPRAGAGRTKGGRNTHPTVKPTELMRYLCRLVTPPGGVVLDPFMGSGSTGKAARLEGFSFIGIEQDAEYCEIARRRIEAVKVQPKLF